MNPGNWSGIITPLPTFDVNLTGNYLHIYYVGVQYFDGFLQYMREFVFDRGLKAVVIDNALLLFFFFMFLTFVCAFIFFRPNK